MNDTDLMSSNLFSSIKEMNSIPSKRRNFLQSSSFTVKFDELESETRSTEGFTRSNGHWCDALSSSFPNVGTKQAWRNGAEKLSQTLNNVKTTLGVLSQRIKKSTRKRQPLVNMESPKSPNTPYTKSKAVLGRTPTKLYSPFSIDTPTGKENISTRNHVNKPKFESANFKGGKKKMKRTKLDLDVSPLENNDKFKEDFSSNDLLQTQIGIYEFQSVANRIVQKGLNY